MDGFDDVPGPRVRGHGNWLIWYYFVMFVASIAQLGGIVGGVGQALSISYPITGYGKQFNRMAETHTRLIVLDRQFHRQLESEHEDAESTLEEFALKEWLKFVSLKEEMFDDLEGISDHYRPVVEADPMIAIRLHKIGVQVAKCNDLRNKMESETDPKLKIVAESEYSVSEKVLKDLVDQLKKKNVDAEPYISLLKKNLDDPYDDEIWAALITVVTMFILVLGRFVLIQNFSTALVALFTLVTLLNIFLLQANSDWGFSMGDDIATGLQFKLPPGSSESLSIALMAFGIIGVGATELVMYPYWCQEKGYGRFVGENDGSQEWRDRAAGWMRVMRWDAWCSMIVYTFATIAFYLLGASILWRAGLTPEGNDTIRYLSVMYRPVFGPVAQSIFLFGAFAVLYSTFFVANASLARTFSDAIRVMGFAKKESYRKMVVFFSGFFPLCCIVIYVFYPKPVELVLISGLMQAIMLPMLAAAAIFYRYYRIEKPLQPGLIWDVFLWISALGMLVAGGWLAIKKLVG